MSTITRERDRVAVWTPADALGVLAEVLDRGGVLAVPTGSSYALAADPASDAGVASIFRIKQRPPLEPLPVVAADVSRFERLGVDAGSGLGGLERAWPGPLSVVLACRRGLPAAAGGASLAVRVPGDHRLLELLARLDRPLTATSANRSGEPPLLTPVSLQALLAGHDATIVDAGPCTGGAPSTLVRLDGEIAHVLRIGRISLRRLRELAPKLEIREASAGGPR